MAGGNIVILTGAGVSAESGISTFRDAGGLWETHRFEDLASPAGFRRNPDLVHRFYNLRRAQLHEVAPNAAHAALAEMERGWHGDFLLVTQNVDDLHERAGSVRLLHMHGELRKLRCAACGAGVAHDEDAGVGLVCAHCAVSGRMRPDIVWFGEMPLHMAAISAALDAADIFVAIGTSGVVYPAASFVSMARANGRNCKTYEINPLPTGSRDFGHVIAEQASSGVRRLMAEIAA
jgi:NAD-dependent deacetylase